MMMVSSRAAGLFAGCFVSAIFGISRASVPCSSDGFCQALYETIETECLEESKTCSNPFQKGCLPGSRPRICNSDDIKNDGVNKSLCVLPELDYPEVRLFQQDWEAAIFLAWVHQILLMEVVGVPATVGLTTEATAYTGFYSPVNTMEYGPLGYPYDALEKANTVEDCTETEEPCAHVIMEEWGQDFLPFVRNFSMVPSTNNGQIGKISLYIPSFTAAVFPEVSTYFGLRGEVNRQKLAEIFKRPTSWKDYCDTVSNSSCTIPDDAARRTPRNTDEGSMYFLDGAYQGHFRATAKNNCTDNEACTGHVATVPCTWNFFLDGMMHWNDIVGLEADGPLPLPGSGTVVHEADGDVTSSGTYDYGTLYQVWRAANATRSHVIMVWYSPEALVEEFFGTDFEFNTVQLPSPTDVCIDSRTRLEDRCSIDIQVRRGQQDGSCDTEPTGLQKLMSASLATQNKYVEEAYQSPAYEFIKNIKLSELDMNRIFKKWIQPGVDQFGNDARSAVCSWVTENYDELFAFVPDRFPREFSDQNAYDEWYLVLAEIVAILVGHLAVIGVCLCWIYRRTKVMVFAQPLFIGLMLVGFASIATGAALMAVEPTDTICVSHTWLIPMGIVIEMVPVMVKTAAINRLIQSSRKSVRVTISRRRLLTNIFVCIIVVAAYMVAWTVVDAPKAKVTLRQDSDDPSLLIQDLLCRSEYAYWRIIEYVGEVFLLFVAAVLAFQNRGVLKEFNDANSLGIMVYSHAMFMVVRGIINIFFLFPQINFATISVMLSLNYSLDSLLAMLIYICPKLEQARRHPEDYLEEKRMGKATTNKSTILPDDDLRILCCTANIGNAEPTLDSMEAMIPRRGACDLVFDFDGEALPSNIFDLVIVGMQEATWRGTEKKTTISKKDMDEEDVLNAMEEHHTATIRGLMEDILGSQYSPVVVEMRGQMRLFIWASNSVMKDITDVRVDGANTGIGGVIANKGGIVVSLSYQTTRLSFLTAHLAAHEGETHYKARCENLKTIINESSTYALSTKLDAIVSSHHMFVMGDLNFRTRFDGDGTQEDNVSRALQFIEEKDYISLYDLDELQQGLNDGDLLLGFQTLPCLFPPTFKVERQEGFVYKTQRVPSYTDRILFRSAQGFEGCLTPVAYEPCPDFITSDHKPVRAAFDIETKVERTYFAQNVDMEIDFRELECSGLPAVDSNGFSDPYLLFLWDKSISFRTGKGSLQEGVRSLFSRKGWPRTKYIPKTLNPKWEGQVISLVANRADLDTSEAMLYIVAMDHNRVPVKDVFLGAFSLPIREIAHMMDDEVDAVMDFDRALESGGKFAGRIKFQLHVRLPSRSGSTQFSIRPSLRRRSSLLLGLGSRQNRQNKK